MLGTSAKTKKAAKAKPIAAVRHAETATPEPNPLWHSLALRPARIQAELTVSRPDDPYELEADSIADKVRRMASPGAVDFGPPSTGAHTPKVLCECGHCEDDGVGRQSCG